MLGNEREGVRRETREREREREREKGRDVELARNKCQVATTEEAS